MEYLPCGCSEIGCYCSPYRKTIKSKPKPKKTTSKAKEKKSKPSNSTHTQLSLF